MIMFCSRALSLTLLVISHFTHLGGVTWYMKLRIEACVSRVHSGYAFVKYSPICRERGVKSYYCQMTETRLRRHCVNQELIVLTCTVPSTTRPDTETPA